MRLRRLRRQRRRPASARPRTHRTASPRPRPRGHARSGFTARRHRLRDGRRHCQLGASPAWASRPIRSAGSETSAAARGAAHRPPASARGRARPADPAARATPPGRAIRCRLPTITPSTNSMQATTALPKNRKNTCRLSSRSSILSRHRSTWRSTSRRGDSSMPCDRSVSHRHDSSSFVASRVLGCRIHRAGHRVGGGHPQQRQRVAHHLADGRRPSTGGPPSCASSSCPRQSPVRWRSCGRMVSPCTFCRRV